MPSWPTSAAANSAPSTAPTPHDLDRLGAVVTASEADDGVPWRAFHLEATSRLREAGFASPEVDARRIVERAAGFEGSAFHAGLDEFATARSVAYFDALLARRLKGEPLQYVLGVWGFRTLDLFVDRRVLIPRPETETVVEFALTELDRVTATRRARGDDAPAVVVDLGTGSGAIALSIAAERAGVAVWATDVSANALAVAQSNLAGLGLAATRVRLREGSWFAALPGNLRGGIDLVVSNPPYVAPTDELPVEVRDWEPTGALIPGPTGREALDHLVDEGPEWLRPGGVLVVELAPDQAEAVAARARQAGFAQAVIGPDLTGRARAVIARR